MKTILITGATDGIGLATAKKFALSGHTLLLHGRNKVKLENIKNELLLLKNDAVIELYQADFSILQDVLDMAALILQRHKQLDVLINNAGVFVVDELEAITKDKLDIRFQVNTIAPYILTKKLLPILDIGSRVINLGSAAQAPVNLQALISPTAISTNEAYAQSKLALIMWSMEMAENPANKSTIIAVNPKSFLGSKMVREAYGQKGYDLDIGAEILYKAALSDDFKNANGQYFDNDYAIFAEPHPFALSKNNRQALVDALENFG